MEHIVYWVMNTIRNNEKVNVNTLLSSVIDTMNLNIHQQENGLWYGDYDGLDEGANNKDVMDWIIGYMDAFYEL